jgi:hypothetical protein
MLLVSAIAIAGCNPAGYLSKNMCNIFDCDTLFFIEDLFPLSARPGGGGSAAAGSAAAGGAGDGAAAEEEAEPAGEHEGH